MGNGGVGVEPGSPTVLLSVQQAAETLGLRPWSVRQMISAGVLPVYRIGPRGTTIRIAEADVTDYLRSRVGLLPKRGRPEAALQAKREATAKKGNGRPAS